MNLLVLTSTYPRFPGDTLPTFVHELCKRLVQAGHRVHVLTPRLPGGRRYDVIDGVEVERFPYFLAGSETLTGEGGILARIRQHPWRIALVPWFLGGFAFALLRATRRRTYALIHAHWLIPQGMLAAALTRWLPPIPLVCTAHGSDIHALDGAMFRRLRQAVVTRSTLVTVVSAALRDSLLRAGAPPERIAVASMGVDFSQRFQAPAHITREPRRLIFVGRLVKAKGVHVLLDAFTRLRREFPDATLEIIGSGPQDAALRDQATAAGHASAVVFSGALPQEALPARYARAAIAVVPSLAEGFGLVVLEALGCGCAVVASDLPALRALIADGYSGRLFPPGNPEALAEALLALMRDPARVREYAARGLEHAARNYHWDAVTGRYLALYQRALGGDESLSEAH